MLFLLVGAGLLLWWWWTGYRRFRTWNWEAFWNESAIPSHTLTENTLSDSVALEVHPQTALEDEPLTLFRIRGLRPGQEVDVRATTKTWKGQTWTAVATFRADDRGEVDLATRVPRKGTYHRADPMGLFWSMRPRHPEKAPVFLPPINGYTVDLTVEAEGRLLAHTRVQRLLRRPDLFCREVRENDLLGVHCSPPGEGPFPAVLLIGGSEGYNPAWLEIRASWWASHGVVAFAQAYYGTPPLPDHLVRIPIERFLRALAWLRTQPGVDPDRVFILGGSRGSEAALLAAIHADPPPAGVIALMPGHVRWMGLDFHGGPKPAWTFQGQDLPFVSTGWDPAFLRLMVKHPARLRSAYARRLDRGIPEEAKIPVERLKAPLLLISGTDDQMWPSTRMAGEIVKRLQAHGMGDRVHHLVLEGAGHLLFYGYRPPVRLFPPFLTGGVSREANVDGGLKAWHAMLDFVKGHTSR